MGVMPNYHDTVEKSYHPLLQDNTHEQVAKENADIDNKLKTNREIATFFVN